MHGQGGPSRATGGTGALRYARTDGRGAQTGACSRVQTQPPDPQKAPQHSLSRAGDRLCLSHTRTQFHAHTDSPRAPTGTAQARPRTVRRTRTGTADAARNAHARTAAGTRKLHTRLHADTQTQ